jgi:hypothetical protein
MSFIHDRRIEDVKPCDCILVSFLCDTRTGVSSHEPQERGRRSRKTEGTAKTESETTETWIEKCKSCAKEGGKEDKT